MLKLEGVVDGGVRGCVAQDRNQAHLVSQIRGNRATAMLAVYAVAQYNVMALAVEQHHHCLQGMVVHATAVLVDAEAQYNAVALAVEQILHHLTTDKAAVIAVQ